MAPNHFLNQCWNIGKWNLGNKLQWNFNRAFLFKKMHLKLSSAKWLPSRSQCAKAWWWIYVSVTYPYPNLNYTMLVNGALDEWEDMVPQWNVLPAKGQHKLKQLIYEGEIQKSNIKTLFELIFTRISVVHDWMEILSGCRFVNVGQFI